MKSYYLRYRYPYPNKIRQYTRRKTKTKKTIKKRNAAEDGWTATLIRRKMDGQLHWYDSFYFQESWNLHICSLRRSLVPQISKQMAQSSSEGSRLFNRYISTQASWKPTQETAKGEPCFQSIFFLIRFNLFLYLLHYLFLHLLSWCNNMYCYILICKIIYVCV